LLCYKLSIEGWLFLRCTIFSNVLEKKNQLLSPDDNPRLETTVERKVSRASEERSPTELGVPSVSGEQEEVALSFYEEAAEDGRWCDSLAAGGS
jgi:hypothetical protein